MIGSPYQMGAPQQDPAAQQQMLQQQAMQQRAMQAAAQQRAQQQAAQMQMQQQAAAMQGGGQGGIPAAPGGMQRAQQVAPQAAPPSLMQQLGQFGSPMNSALLNFGLETMNAGQQGRSTAGSLFSGLGGGAGAYIQGRQMEEEQGRQGARDEQERRLLALQEMALRDRMRLTGGGGQGGVPTIGGSY